MLHFACQSAAGRAQGRSCGGTAICFTLVIEPGNRLVIFLGSYQLTCRAARGDGPSPGWVADWQIAQIGAGSAGDRAGSALSATFPDHRSAMAAARVAGMVTLEAMHAEAQRQLEPA
ncbi:hypothetical protein GGR74_000979 [Xanthomonas arboricola]|nr:hypothetical protein [Xanthomonas euroxanthea]